MPYNAFISYSHNADSALAAALQSALHRFAKPWYKLRALHIFRDQTNLAVNPALWSSIREALDQSSFFILLASPEAAASPWVAKEAEYWVGRNGPSNVLIVLTGGSLQWDRANMCFPPGETNPLPPCLLRAFPEEPLFLDLRWSRESPPRYRLGEPRFHEAILQLASTLHNRPKDELDGADIRARRHTRLLAASGFLAIVLIAIFASYQTLGAKKTNIKNLAARLAASSAKVLADSPDQAGEAALLAIESTRLNPSFEGNQALRAAVSLLPSAAQFYPPQDTDPAERVRDIAFSPDGGLLAVERDNGSTQVLDLASHKPLGYFTPDEHPAASIELRGDSRDSTSDDSASDNDAAVSVAFNAGGALLASAGRNGVAHIWSVRDGREVLRISHGAPLSQIAFRPKANQFATASDDGHVRLFDIARAAVLADFKCPDKAVALAFGPEGNFLAAFSSDGIVSILDSASGKRVRTLTGGEAAFNLSMSNDGKRLAAAGGDFAFAWNVATGQRLLRATHAASSETLTPQQWIVDAAISPDGKLLAYAARGEKFAHVWNVDTGRQILELKHDSAVAAVVFNGDGTKLGTGSYDGTARVWEIPSGNELERTPHMGGAEVVAFSPNGSRFAAGGVDGSISVSNTQRADRPAIFELPSAVRSVAFSPDGQHVAIGSLSTHSSPLVRIAGISGDIAHDIEFHGAPVIDRLFFLDSNNVIAEWSSKLFLLSPEQTAVTSLRDISGNKRIERSGKVLAAQQDGVSKLYTLPRLQQISTFAGPTSTLLGTANAGALFAFEASEPPDQYFIDIWSAPGKTRISHIPLPAALTRFAFNSMGTILFTAQSENLQAWDIPSGKRRFSLAASGDIDSIVPEPSSSSFATIAHGRLTIWDAANGVRLAELPDMGYLRAAAFSPDGRYLLAGYDERAAALWLWRSDDLRDQACARLARNLTREEWANSLPGQPYRQTCPNLPPAN